MKSKIIVLVLAVLFSSTVFAESFNDMMWMTEDYPPYNFQQNGVKQGISIDILLEIWKKIGLNKGPEAIKIIPWNRGVKTLNSTPGSCLFATTLTAERRDKLGWKYVLAIPQVVAKGSGNHLIAKKSAHITFSSPDDIKNFKHHIGVVRGDVGEGLLVGTGIDAGKVDEASDPDLLIKKLNKGRIDVVSYGYSTVVTKLKEQGIDPDQYEIVYTFPPAPMGYAFYKDTDPALLKAFQKALDELNADGTTAKIKAKYVK